ncbi:hypothetical protein VFPBJ_01808 [Purpureocillium lilacinum]|uniref:Uncharacterized protein n=1 Tax=Purpureocillium lilacinum TaxID=33203 RepID=A0A179HC19_PURLI|nr:hypothetical protein VFPBJ_01808 [Purpureocillium lilacinum]
MAACCPRCGKTVLAAPSFGASFLAATTSASHPPQPSEEPVLSHCNPDFLLLPELCYPAPTVMHSCALLRPGAPQLARSTSEKTERIMKQAILIVIRGNSHSYCAR